MNSNSTTPILTSALVSLALLILIYQPSTVHAQGTAFTYQARLDANGGPADGIYDLRFAIYDVISGGVTIARPVTNSATTVRGGLFTVTLDFGAGVFTDADRWMEIGVRTNGGGAFTTLVPRQTITPTPYAMFSGGVNASGISGTIPAGSIGSGAITSNMLAAGAAAANLRASGQSGVASGGLVLSAMENNPDLENAGYVKIGATTISDAWLDRSKGMAPTARNNHTAVWTGSEMIIWGGASGGVLNTGARYDPVGDSWTTVSSTAAPSARSQHTAVWTGSEMIIWGGTSGGGSYLNTGGRYNPAANTWSAVSTVHRHWRGPDQGA
jgi:hypothetical protein